MSATVSFGEIPSNWQVPGAYAEVTPVKAGSTLTTFPVRLLIVGSAIPGVAVCAVAVPYTITSGAQADYLFGAGSALAMACRAVLTASPYVPVDAICVANATGATKATAQASISGTPKASGTTAIYVNGVRCEVVIDTSTTVAQWTANLAATCNAAASQIGASATVSNGIITLSTLDLGSIYNDIDIRLSPLPGDQIPGLFVGIAPFSGAAGTPDITAAISAVQNTWYTDIVCCFNDATNLATLATEMARRFKAMAKLDAHGYYGYNGTYGQTLGLAAGVNSKFLSTLPASNPLWAPWVAAAVLGAVSAQALNNDPARQLRTLVLTGLEGLAPVAADLYTDAMRNVLLSNGMSTFTVARDGTVMIERVVTNYQFNPTGQDDTAWQDIMVPKTNTRVRYDWDAFIEETYPRSKLTDDGSIAAEYAADTVTPGKLKASWAGRSAVYEQLGWLQDTTALAKQAIFVINPTNKNRCDSQTPINIIGNFMNLMTSLQFEV